MTAGLGYSFRCLGVPAAALQHVADVCGQLLGRPLLAALPAQPAVGCKRPPPCSPGTLAAAAAAGEPGGGGTSADNCGTGGASTAGQPADLLSRLQAAGHKIRDLKEQHFEGISYGQLRLALAHLGRINPEPWAEPAA